MRKNPTKTINNKNEKTLNLLVIRFSSMGDVALTVPVIKGLLDLNDRLFITLATRPLYAPFFEGIPRLDLFICDFDGEYAGLKGIFRLFKNLKSRKKYDSVIDLHGVLRTRILNMLFQSSGLNIHSINKGRDEKKQLIRGKIFRPLKNTLERYVETFSSFNLKFNFPDTPVLMVRDDSVREADIFIRQKGVADEILIGVAPFTLHELKTWPLQYTEQLIQLLENRFNAFVFLFGGAEKEIMLLEKLSRGHPKRMNLAGKFSLGTQLAFIQKMKFMVTMDSANMHLAALSGIKTVTIWGGTHPYAGFSAYQQAGERNIQISKKELPCRPCTVFGAGTCKRGDFACMNWLTPQVVYEKIRAMNLLENGSDKM
ncbi:MAG: glycosyltransferase family 9 protein [Cyclobacteriaceae bacterium]|nr:glycosyltransferase family 9 protein [Cyclobacteriaceae bacterium]